MGFRKGATIVGKKMVDKELSAEEKIIQGLESFADALESGEDITERFTCRKVVLDLAPISYSPAMVKEARSKLGVSQALFAQFIGASLSSVRAWEQGDREPSQVACRFMDEIVNDPETFRKRFLQLASPAGSC